MKTLILTMTCGEGHNIIAKSLKEKFVALGHEAQIEQIYRSNPRKLKSTNSSYLFALKYIPKSYNYFWNKLRTRQVRGRYNNIIQKDVAPYIKDMLFAINEYKPDAIICTHYHASTIISNLILSGKIPKDVTTYSVLSDYCVHPYWESSINIDYIITPISEVNGEFFRRGFSDDRLLCLGFPTSEKFSTPVDKLKARDHLGIKKDDFVITAVAGGNGIGLFPLVKKICESDRKFILNVICGKNVKIKTAIEKFVAKKKLNYVRCHGFVKNIETIMGASDCIINRGSAVICTEALNLNIPLIIRENMLTNENINKQILVSNGCAVGMEKIGDIIPIISNFIDNPDELEKIRKNMKAFAKPNAINNIAKTIIEKYGELRRTQPYPQNKRDMLKFKKIIFNIRRKNFIKTLKAILRKKRSIV